MVLCQVSLLSSNDVAEPVYASTPPPNPYSPHIFFLGGGEGGGMGGGSMLT